MKKEEDSKFNYIEFVEPDSIAEQPEKIEKSSIKLKEIDGEIGNNILKCLNSITKKIGRTTLSSILVGSKSNKILNSNYDKNFYFGYLNGYTKRQVLGIIDFLISESYIKININNAMYSLVELTSKGYNSINSNDKILLNHNLIKITKNH